MFKGLIAGLLAGTAVSAAVLSAVSLMSPPPGPVVAVASPEPAVTPEPAPPPAADAPEPQDAPTAPAPQDAAVAPSPDAAVLEVPPASEFARPPADAPAVVPGTTEAPLMPAPAAEATAPAAEPEPALLPDAPATAPEAAAAAPEPAATPAAEDTPSVTAAADPGLTAPAPVPPSALPDADAAPSAPEPAPAAVPEPEAMAPEAAPADALPGDDAPAPDEGMSDLPPLIVPDAPEAPQGVVSAPKPGFARTVPGVRVNRLPTIGGDGAGVAAEPLSPDDLPETTEAEIAIEDEPQTAMRGNAALFDNPDNAPLLGVVVIDLGARHGGLDPDGLMALPVPVTIALNPLNPDTADVAARYRAQGFEVAMLADALPKDGSPADIEVAFQSLGAALPEAVALIPSPENTMLSRRPVAQQIVTILKDEGLGLISYARGLNPARELALASGLPQVEVARVADEPRADAAGVERVLKRAAFDAQQKGRTVIVLRSYPDSITALAAFIAEGGNGVRVAPITALMP